MAHCYSIKEVPQYLNTLPSFEVLNVLTLPFRDIYTFQLVKTYFFSLEGLKSSPQPCYLFQGK